MTLLLVNDIVLEADTMAAQISWGDYGISKVYTAYSAESAKHVMTQNQVDILLCDIEMPGENGLSLIRWVKDSYDTDCILLTCHANFDYAREGISLGCQDYLLLPSKYEDIGNSVKRACDSRLSRQHNARLQSYGKNWLQHQASIEKSETHTVQTKPAELVETCIHYILNHISDEDLSVTEIAANVYLNPVYLNRIFRKEKGINLSQWITKERMELAASLLRIENLTANEVAFRAGYRNYSYFSTVFKSYFGLTPSQFVRNRKE